jgi:hypothetical protein
MADSRTLQLVVVLALLFFGFIYVQQSHTEKAQEIQVSSEKAKFEMKLEYAEQQRESQIQQEQMRQEILNDVKSALSGVKEVVSSAVKQESKKEPERKIFQSVPSNCGGGSNPNYYSCRREALLHGCSDICDTSMTGEPSKYFNFVKKNVDCMGLWANEAIDEGVTDDLWPPPVYPPPEFLEDYQQGGRVKIQEDP